MSLTRVNGRESKETRKRQMSASKKRTTDKTLLRLAQLDKARLAFAMEGWLSATC